LKTVHFKYQTELTFPSFISEHRFLLKILPQSDDRQRIINLSWNINPMPEDTVWQTVDGFGNAALAGNLEAPHSNFIFGIEGSAEVSESPCTSFGKPPRVLLYPSELTRSNRKLTDFYNDIANSAPKETLDRIKYFSNAVNSHLRYERGVTTNATTAQEAFEIGAGVCQDYSHILLAILRIEKIPCRYVAGLASDYGETHAWVEAWIGEKFCAIDPTRNKLIDEGYIAISKGRDFADCSIERGVFKGISGSTETVSLSMKIL